MVEKFKSLAMISPESSTSRWDQSINEIIRNRLIKDFMLCGAEQGTAAQDLCFWLAQLKKKIFLAI
jgi:hypothetical protein